jgi:predicted RNA methylase
VTSDCDARLLEMLDQQGPPSLVADPGCGCGRLDDVGEEHGGQQPTGLDLRALADEEREDVLDESVDVVGVEEVI